MVMRKVLWCVKNRKGPFPGPVDPTVGSSPRSDPILSIVLYRHICKPVEQSGRNARITRPSRATVHALSVCVQLVPRYIRTQTAITCTAPEGGVNLK